MNIPKHVSGRASTLLKTLKPRSTEELEGLKHLLCAVQDGYSQFVEFATCGGPDFKLAKGLIEEVVAEMAHGTTLAYDALVEAIQIYCENRLRLKPQLI